MNPASGSGRGRALLAQIEDPLRQRYPAMGTRILDRPGCTATAVNEMLALGHDLFLVIGGDGTLSEVVDALLSAGVEHPRMALLPAGRGSDFARGLGLDPDPAAVLRTLEKPSRPVDAGRITQLSTGRRRHFINIADAGLGGLVVEQIRDRGLPMGGMLTYLTAALRCLFLQRRWFMEMRWHGGVINGGFIAVAVANGPYFGGGMHMAVGASPHDGTFRVVAVESQGWLGLLGIIPRLYQGTIHHHDRVRCFDTATLEIHGRTHTPMEVDGEPGFELPARLEVLPGVLHFHGA